MCAVQAVHPQENLALIIQSSGLTQADICKKIEKRGYQVARATINRWANPQKRTRNFTYNPVTMLCLLEVCSEGLIVPLTLSDLFSEREDLSSKLQVKKAQFNPFPGLLQEAARNGTGKSYRKWLCGKFSTDLNCDHAGGDYFATELEISEQDHVSFAVTCRLSRRTPLDRDREDEIYVGHGTLLAWDDKALLTVEIDMETLTMLTIQLGIPRGKKIPDHFDAVAVMAEGGSASAPWSGRVTLCRTNRSRTVEPLKHIAIPEAERPHAPNGLAETIPLHRTNLANSAKI